VSGVELLNSEQRNKISSKHLTSWNWH